MWPSLPPGGGVRADSGAHPRAPLVCPAVLWGVQKERLNRSTELTVVHESLLEEEAADEGEALLAESEKVRTRP